MSRGRAPRRLQQVSLPSGSTPADLAVQLAAGVHPPDAAFDQHLPADIRSCADRHFTPLHVVGRAVRWLEAAGARTLVDIGAGPGKFCVVAALCGRLRCTGLEERPRLVEAARDLARLFAVQDRVTFVEGPFAPADVPAADAYYMFNPFAESIFSADERIDDRVEHNRDRYERDVCAARAFLRGLPAGALVLTYHGYGGQMPASYEELYTDTRVPALLRLYHQTARRGG